jgi:hypothetical protein
MKTPPLPPDLPVSPAVPPAPVPAPHAAPEEPWLAMTDDEFDAYLRAEGDDDGPLGWSV